VLASITVWDPVPTHIGINAVPLGVGTQAHMEKEALVSGINLWWFPTAYILIIITLPL